MFRKPIHLQLLEESRKNKYNLDEPSKTKMKLVTSINNARNDEHKNIANTYAISL